MSSLSPMIGPATPSRGARLPFPEASAPGVAAPASGSSDRRAVGLADMPTVVFTDGACLGNPGPGGWAWAVSAERFAVGAEARTTNQRMELTAVLDAPSGRSPGRSRS